MVRNFLQAQIRDSKKPRAYSYRLDPHVEWNACRVLYGRLSLLKGERRGEGLFPDHSLGLQPLIVSPSPRRGERRKRPHGDLSPRREHLRSELLQSVPTDNPRTPALKSPNW